MKLVDRIAAALFIRDPPEYHLEFFSVECIKLIFDAVRNFGLCAVVGVAGYFLGEHIPGAVGESLKWLLFICAAALLILNAVFMESFLTRTTPFQGSSAILLLAFLLLLVVLGAGVVFTFAAFFRGLLVNG